MSKLRIVAVLLSFGTLFAIGAVHVTHTPTARAASCVPVRIQHLKDAPTKNLGLSYGGVPILSAWIEEEIDSSGYRCGVRAAANYYWDPENNCGAVTWSGPGSYLKLLQGGGAGTSLVGTVYPNNSCYIYSNTYHTAWYTGSTCGVWVFAEWGNYPPGVGFNTDTRTSQICV
jgi:hypothetical protein